MKVYTQVVAATDALVVVEPGGARDEDDMLLIRSLSWLVTMARLLTDSLWNGPVFCVDLAVGRFAAGRTY